MFHVFLSIQKPYYYNYLGVNSERKTGTTSVRTKGTYGRYRKGIKGHIAKAKIS